MQCLAKCDENITALIQYRRINRKEEDCTWLRWHYAGRMVLSGKETGYSGILPQVLKVGKERNIEETVIFSSHLDRLCVLHLVWKVETSRAIVPVCSLHGSRAKKWTGVGAWARCFLVVLLAALLQAQLWSYQADLVCGTGDRRKSLQSHSVERKICTYLRARVWELCLSGKAWGKSANR